MKKGKLIVIEGAGDGMGKSTQMACLKKKLESDGEMVFSHHFPSYNTYHGKPVEEYLSGNFGPSKDLSPYFVHSLYAQDRAIAWLTILKKQLEEGKMLLMDRYTTSSLLYQSAYIDDIVQKKEFLNFVSDYEYNKLQIKKPDNVIFLYSSFELINQMRNNRKINMGVEKDIHEMDLEYMKRVYYNAMFVADYLSWDMINCEKNNSMRSIADIHQEVYKLVKKK